MLMFYTRLHAFPFQKRSKFSRNKDKIRYLKSLFQLQDRYILFFLLSSLVSFLFFSFGLVSKMVQRAENTHIKTWAFSLSDDGNLDYGINEHIFHRSKIYITLRCIITHYF
jgi:hypothetical protein